MKKKPTKFMVQTTVRYSDDSGQVLERTFNVGEEETYQDFMSRMSEIYEQIRFTFGADAFDNLYVEKPEEEPEEEVKNIPETE